MDPFFLAWCYRNWQSKKTNKRSMGLNSLTWIKQLLQICHAVHFPVLPQQPGHKFDPAVKMSKVILSPSFEETCRPLVPDAILQNSALKLSWFWRRRFLSNFYHIWMPYCSMVQNHLNKLSIPLLQKTLFIYSCTILVTVISECHVKSVICKTWTGA